MSWTPRELQFPREGRVAWIGLAPAKRAPLDVVDRVLAEVGTGLKGDHHATRRATKRQVTLIQAEHLPVIAALTGREQVDPGLLRRNLVVRGINLYALRGARFRVGEAVFEGTGLCDPCERMEANLGPGGFNAMRAHGGILARVVQEGWVALDDPVVFEGYLEGASWKDDLH